MFPYFFLTFQKLRLCKISNFIVEAMFWKTVRNCTSVESSTPLPSSINNICKGGPGLKVPNILPIQTNF